jgi:uroporphyrinogen-III synthase
VAAFQADVVAACVGPVTAAAFEMWGVPTMIPDRSRTAAMVKMLQTELPLRREGLLIELAGGHQLLLHGDAVILDGAEVKLSPAPAAVLGALVAKPSSPCSPPAPQAPSTRSRWRSPGSARRSAPRPSRPS